MALVEAAADFAREVLAPGGAFSPRCFRAAPRTTLLAALKRDFATVKHVKPAASRADSAELYVLATGFRGCKLRLRENRLRRPVGTFFGDRELSRTGTERRRKMPSSCGCWACRWAW